MTLPEGVELRRLLPSDSMDELTDLLHRAYAPLLQAGLRFQATHQDPATTLARCAAGECWVLVHARRLIGTVTFRDAARTEGCPHYDEADVASLGQLCVDPDWQGRGLGAVLMDLAERRAAETGATRIAVDTSEQATRLVETYARRGYVPVERVRWEVTNYRSVVMSLLLDGRPGSLPSAGRSEG